MDAETRRKLQPKHPGRERDNLDAPYWWPSEQEAS
jgi:hypothetical protein